MRNETGTWVDQYLERGGRILGVVTAVAGLGVIAWGWHTRNLLMLAFGVVLVLLGVTFLVYPIDAGEIVVHLLFYWP